jgi:tetratricopeptide (TPR) repeat protein
LPKALREFQKAIEIDPQRVDSYLNLGAVYVSARQPAEAEGVYKKAVEANPKSSQARVALGQFYFSVGKMAEAEAELQAAIKLDPHAVLPRLTLTPLYLATGRMAEAEKLGTELKTVAPDNPDAYRALGLFYIFTGQKDKAAIEFRTLSKSKPKDTTVSMLLIDTLIELGQIREAGVINKELLKADPGNPQGLLFNGRLLLAERKYDQALTELQRGLKGAPKSAPGYYFLGIAQNALGLPSQARSSWTYALELQPQMIDARLALADLEANSGNYDQALQLAGDALKAHPEVLAAHLIRAKVLLAKGDKKEGETQLKAALDRDPGSLQALTMLTNLLIAEKRSPEVLPRLSKLVEQYPQAAGLHYLLAAVYFSVSDLGKAEASAKQAVMLDRQRADGYSLLGDIHAAQGSVENAKADLQAAIDRNPREVANYLALDTLYEKEGDWERAKEVCEKAHRAVPDSPLVANNLAYLYLEHGGDVNVALSLAQMARQKMPTSPITIDTLGWAYYKLGSPESAVVQLKESAQKEPNNPTFQYHLGMAYMGARQFDLAERSLQKALRSDPKFPDAASAKAALAKISKAPQAGLTRVP